MKFGAGGKMCIGRLQLWLYYSVVKNLRAPYEYSTKNTQKYFK
jgi:hypothetical protein